jgi:hypothetical protein
MWSNSKRPRIDTDFHGFMDWKKIDGQLAGLPAPPRAYALARAAYETANEASLAEQRRESPIVTADDPEPQDPMEALKRDREKWLAHYEVWKAWSDRNYERLAAMGERIIAKYRVHELDALYKAAEKNLVEWAEESISTHYGARFDAVKPAFDAYRSGDLWGDCLEKFLKICFNCPADSDGKPRAANQSHATV